MPLSVRHEARSTSVIRNCLLGGVSVLCVPVSKPHPNAVVVPALNVQLRVLCGEEVALGAGKCELLKALAETGLITKAARAMDISYMHAWSLIQLMNRCFREPLVLSARGGQKGGGARLTDTGRAVLQLYGEMAEASLRAARSAWKRLRPLLTNGGGQADAQLSIALSTAKEDDDFVEQSIRNELPGVVTEIVSDKVLSEVIIQTEIGEMTSVITTRSVKEMGLKIGDKAVALIKATNVSLRREA